MEYANRLSIKANAKINLTLEVLGLRGDGYHELRSVMHSVGISDGIRMERFPAAEGAPRVLVESDAPLPYMNTARRAAEGYLAALLSRGLPDGGAGVGILIEKRIPSEAGLGGGSADAAAVLRGMQRLFPDIGEEALYALGRSVGADVPFCLHGGCALCEGVGERLTTLPAARLHLLIVKPERGVSTGALFRALDESGEPPARDRSAPLVSALKALCGDVRNGTKARLGLLASRLMNDLSPAAEALVPEIAAYRERLLALGALGAEMTGSGSCVFGVFGSREAALRASLAFGDCAFSAVCRGETVPIVIDEG